MNKSSIRCNAVSYRKGFIEVAAGIHTGSINLECWNIHPDIEITASDIRDLDFPDDAVTGNVELELAVADAEKLVEALQAAIAQTKANAA